MAFTLRPYQQRCVNSIWNYFNYGGRGNPVVVAPTGTGKALIIADFIQSVFNHYPQQRVMMLTHVKELIEQNHITLLRQWPSAPAGLYSAGLNKRESMHNVTYAGIQSVGKKPELFGHIDLILIDECHLVSPTSTALYRKFIDALKMYNPHLKVIGFTATPYRVGQGSIVDAEDDRCLFDATCIDLSSMDEYNKFVEEGYLSRLVTKRTGTALDVTGVHKRGGEFVPKELQNAVDKQEITEAAIRECMEEGADRRKWLVFGAGVEHVLNITDQLNHMGISAKAVYSGMKVKERTAVIEGFKAGEFQAIVNNGILTTGFDDPEIDLLVILRPTSSPGLWVQILGRGTRPCYEEGFDLMTAEGRLAAINAGPKQNCLVLDFGANTARLGPINDPRIPSKPGEGGGEAPVKCCEKCNTYFHASLETCPECGHFTPHQTKLEQASGNAEVVHTENPVIDYLKVDHTTVSLHTKKGAPNIMKVSYMCGMSVFTDYVCIEHDGYAGKKARDWWAERTELPYPDRTANAIALSGDLKVATSIGVWSNKKFPELLYYCFDGTHFGKEAVDSFVPMVDTEDQLEAPIATEPKFETEFKVPGFDDDIPF